MMVLAMSAAVLVGGGPMLMTEASVSAIIIGSTAASSLGLFPTRPIEGLVGGLVAFAVHSLVFPPDPLLHVSRAANAVFGALGRTLEDLAAVLRSGDRARAERALEAARGIDGDVRALGEALTIGTETARSAPMRRPARAALDRQQEIARHLDFAVRNTRVLARDTLRYARSGDAPVPDLADAVRSGTGGLGARRRLRGRWRARGTASSGAPGRGPASDAIARHADRTLIEIAGQVRSTAADLVRASQARAPDESDLAEASTEEMLANHRHAAPQTPNDARCPAAVAPRRRFARAAVTSRRRTHPRLSQEVARGPRSLPPESNGRSCAKEGARQSAMPDCIHRRKVRPGPRTTARSRASVRTRAAPRTRRRDHDVVCLPEVEHDEHDLLVALREQRLDVFLEIELSGRSHSFLASLAG